MASLEELQAQRKKLLERIKAKGGKSSAPKLTEQLSNLDSQIRNARGGSGSDGPKITQGPIENSIQTTNQIFSAADEYGQSQADKYVPSGTFGTISTATTPEMQAFLNRLNDFAATAGNYTDTETEALNLLRNSLAGYSSPELLAMREQAQGQMNSDLATAQRQQAIRQSRGNLSGASAIAQAQGLDRQRMIAGGNLERDLIIKQADEQQHRREAFANLVRTTEDARFGRKVDSEQLYGGALTGEEGARSQREMFNVNQGTNEALTRAGVAASGAGTYAGTLSGQQGVDLQNQYLDYLTKTMQTNKDLMLKQIDAYNQRLNSQFGSLGVP